MNAPVKFVGHPDGPKVFVPEIGWEVATFTTKPGGKHPALIHHVPLKCRGPYRPEELADYDPQKPYRTDPFGYALCQRPTLAGERCPKRALNRSPACNVHGGRLHPLDKIQKEMEDPSNSSEAEALSRHQQFLAKQIGVEDLDDEELAACGFRSSNGRIYKPRKIPREMAQAFNKAIYERAANELRGNVIDAAKTVAEIMRNTSVEPDIRLKAANTLLDRGLGKAPQVVALTADRAFEEVFSDLFGGTRDESRNQRIESERIGELPPLDAEIVGERSNPVGTVDESGQSDGTGDQQPVSESSGNEVVPEQAVRSDDSENQSLSNPRASERNEAIMAQTVEIKPFNYDLTDHSQDVKKATQKRYAGRALGVDLTSPDYPLQREVLPNGMIRHVDPLGKANLRPSKSAEKRRKTYTLSDFD